MIYKYILLIISFTTALCFSDQIEPKTLSFIYKNREYFLEHCGLSDSISKQSYKEWKEKGPEIISSMIYSSLKSYSKISDSLYLKLLISVLDLPDYRPPIKPKDTTRLARYVYLTLKSQNPPLNWVRDALNFLIHRSALPVLRRYDDLIKIKLSKCEAPEEQKLQLMALLDLSDNEKQELLTRIDLLEYPSREDSLKKELEKEKDIVLELAKKGDPDREEHYQRTKKIEQELRRIRVKREKTGKETFLWMRARAGEEDATGNLIKIFKTGDFNKKNKEIEALCMVGSDTCIKTLLESFDKRLLSFQKDQFTGEHNGFCYSLRKSMLINLKRNYPYEDIFKPSKTPQSRSPRSDYFNSEHQEEYVKAFSQWAKQKYNVDINYSYELSGPFSEGACTKKDAIRLIEGSFKKAKRQSDFYYERSKKRYGSLLKELKEEQEKK